MLSHLSHTKWCHFILQCALFFPVQASTLLNDGSEEIITRDVCILGGGASGSYAAVRLQELGASVVLIEKKDLLGGHTNAYRDQATNITIDYGVQLFHSMDLVRNHFAKFDIPLTVTFPGGGTSLAVDFRTGKAVEGYVDPASNASALQQAFGSYAMQLAKYPYLQEGFFLPEPVPEDLLLPFSAFIKKYALEAIAYTIFNNAQGFGDYLSQPTLYVLKYFSLRFLEDIQTGFLTTTNANNGALYNKIQQNLGPNVLLQSQIVSTHRTTLDEGYVQLVAKTATGRKLIRAKRILVTIPPTLSNMRVFDLVPNEKSVFGQFGFSGYYTGIIHAPGLPAGLQYNNIAPSTSYNLPVLPGIYNVIPSRVPGLFTVTYGTLKGAESAKEVKETVLKDIERLVLGSGGNTTTKTTFVAFDDHSPYELTVDAKSIEKGFYRNLYALQGHKNTWYSGAAFQMHDSSLLWNFTETLLPRIMSGL